MASTGQVAGTTRTESSTTPHQAMATTAAPARGPTYADSASSTGTSASAGPSQASASQSGPGSSRPSAAVNGSTETSTARVRTRISRVRP